MTDDVATLKAELARLQTRIEQIETADEQPIGRRHMLKALGIGAAGAAAGGLAFGQPAAAADPNDVVKGANNTVRGPTLLTASGGYSPGPSVGVLHVTNDATQTSTNAATSCISAFATGSGGGGQSVAFFGAGSRIGAKLDGPVPLKLTDSTNAGPPGNSGFAGQLRVDDGDLWFCTFNEVLGTNARWRRVTGDADAGMFTAVDPFRVYDSRTSVNPANAGPLAAGGNRVVACRDALDVTNGTVVTANATPAGTSAIAYNVTIVSPSSAGFLSVAPESATAVGASTINWGPSTSGALANGSVVKLAGDREIKVFCGGIGATDFIIDVVGYYG